MSDNSKFWITCWAILATVMIAGIAAVTYYNVNERDTMIDMVRAGVTPAEASCALDRYAGTACMLALQSKQP